MCLISTKTITWLFGKGGSSATGLFLRKFNFEYTNHPCLDSFRQFDQSWRMFEWSSDNTNWCERVHHWDIPFPYDAFWVAQRTVEKRGNLWQWSQRQCFE
jgi:hypothetical protein